MSAAFRISPALWDKIHHFASFPQTGVSLQQMVLFGQHPSQGTLMKASQFLAQELPVRLAHRVKELDELPHNLSDMTSIRKVKNWYAQSFEELINFPPLSLSPAARQSLFAHSDKENMNIYLPESLPNPSLVTSYLDGDGAAGGLTYGEKEGVVYGGKVGGGTYKGNGNGNNNGNGVCGVRNGNVKLRVAVERRYYAQTPSHVYPPEVHDYNARFTKTLDAIKRRHDPTVTTVAQGVFEWQRAKGIKPGMGVGLGHRHGYGAGGGEVQAWLDRFYMSRIGIRFLIGQHVALNTQQPHKDYVGIICTQANIHDILQEAIENARFVCEEHYAMFRGPPVQLICPPDLTFAYVPGHLSHIVFELLKNSLRAVVERFGADYEDRAANDSASAGGGGYPPIKVIVVEGSEDITIKISDEGGGIPRSAIPLIWTYMYTTMAGQSIDQDFQAGDFEAPMAGFGYGLPLSRLYARYFGGDLRLISMDGFGTDVYIHLNKLSSSREPLP
ncbi:hypothetical protein PAXINDRAFT_158703 [Paxillus involutus ATCC 200175]|uniref:Protein-serine/threonine kinase n=1 Tax=Paxillus involutus ATCC 200175 TaxID=664439 RepID=A0A0C9TGV9_PAXIN|nr:hypothetical protein PAXINDRAFT_158703 [Paxillus involutus ATCC 200175]